VQVISLHQALLRVLCGRRRVWPRVLVHRVPQCGKRGKKRRRIQKADAARVARWLPVQQEQVLAALLRLLCGAAGRAFRRRRLSLNAHVSPQAGVACSEDCACTECQNAGPFKLPLLAPRVEHTVAALVGERMGFPSLDDPLAFWN